MDVSRQLSRTASRFFLAHPDRNRRRSKQQAVTRFGRLSQTIKKNVGRLPKLRSTSEARSGCFVKVVAQIVGGLAGVCQEIVSSTTGPSGRIELTCRFGCVAKVISRPTRRVSLLIFVKNDSIDMRKDTIAPQKFDPVSQCENAGVPYSFRPTYFAFGHGFGFRRNVPFGSPSRQRSQRRVSFTHSVFGEPSDHLSLHAGAAPWANASTSAQTRRRGDVTGECGQQSRVPNRV